MRQIAWGIAQLAIGIGVFYWLRDGAPRLPGTREQITTAQELILIAILASGAATWLLSLAFDLLLLRDRAEQDRRRAQNGDARCG
jgi:hypothetical protein